MGRAKWLIPAVGAMTLGFALPAQATSVGMMGLLDSAARGRLAAQQAHYGYRYRYYRYYDDHPRYYRYRYRRPFRYYRRYGYH